MKNTVDGVIGIGSNSTRMSICVSGHPYKIIDRGYALTRLFEGLDKENNLSKESIDRTVNAIISMYEQAHEEHFVKEFWIFATSALRDAQNKQDIIRPVFNYTGKMITIIPGQTEAYYSFVGAGAGVHSRYGVIDIGGGSTEVAIGEKAGPIQTISFQVGALRLLKKFPDMNFQNVHILLNYIQSMLPDKKGRSLSDIEYYIGVGGTFTTLRSLYEGGRFHKGQRRNFTKKQVFDQMKNLFLLTAEQREQYPHMPPGRGDITPYGLAILYTVMEYLSIAVVEIGRGGNLDGWLITHSIETG